MEGVQEVTREKTRIYVGGLGGAVTEDDLRKTFSALGQVVAVDVVRTKGRSFAYLDFLPSSDKSLPKLFSTYNGCMWKGGKLRLEKAKEHYLVRLRREWQDECDHASKATDGCNADPIESHDTLEKPKKPLLAADKTQLRLFFPKLGKVKSLGSVGIGKHKYSFQRIQVPSFPTHFCDCEEHSRGFLPIGKKQAFEFENASEGINEQELDIMNSVMNKIFERANPSKKVTAKSESVNDESADVEDDEEDYLTDEDNLIINVANGRDNMDLLGEMRSMMANRVSEPVAKTPKSVQKKTTPLSKKRKSPHLEEKDGRDTVIPETSRNSQMILDTKKDSKTKVESSTKLSGDNSLRSLKSTWKDLIGKKGKTPFNISDIISTVPKEKKVKFNGDGTDHTLAKNVHDAQKKKNLVHNKKSEDKNVLVSSVPETTPSSSHINKESTTEVGSVIMESTQSSNLDILAYDSQQADESDIHPIASEQKEDEEPRTDDLDVFLTSNVENNNVDKQENAESQLDNSMDLEKPTEALPAKHDEDFVRTARGDSWRHKSSWTQLISTTSHTSFSISQIVPNLSFEKHEPQADDAFDHQPENKNLNTFSADAAPINGQSPDGVVTDATVKKNTSEQKRILSLGNLESEDTCSFMRTESSMKEWKKAKASRSGSLNKKKKPVQESA